MRAKDGSLVWALDRGEVVERDAEGRPPWMYGTHADITERKALEERIRELAMRDPLTGLYKRRFGFDRLAETAAEFARRGRDFSVAILDIDHFKNVNDGFGHQAGDFVLQAFAGELASSARRYDLLGRYGGEEFVLVSPNATAAEVAALIERMMLSIRRRAFTFEGRDISLTFSAGLASASEFPRGGLDLEQLVGLADKRLYEAKRLGRDRFVRA